MTTDSVNSLLAVGIPPASTTQQPKKIHDAAQQFEALMVGEMLKTARESDPDGWMGTDEGTGDDSAMDMAESQFANALAKNGGLGLSKMIESSLQHATADSQNVAQSPYALSVASSKKP